MSDTNLLEQLESYVPFLDSLRKMDTIKWKTPISDGKWAVQDIVSHIMMWDKNFLDNYLPKLLSQESVPLEGTDVQKFNDEAVAYGKTLTQSQLIDEAIFYRAEIVSQLRKLPKSVFSMVFPGWNSFTLTSFLTDLFVSHDTHHKKQIQEFISKDHL